MRPTVTDRVPSLPSVCHSCEPCENGWTNRDAIRVVDLGGSNESCVRWRSRSPHTKGQFLGDRTCRGMSDNTLPWAVQKWLNRARWCLGCGFEWAQGSMSYVGCTLAQPGKYDWIVQVRQRCSLFVKLLWLLVIRPSLVLGSWEWYCWLGSTKGIWPVIYLLPFSQIFSLGGPIPT